MVTLIVKCFKGPGCFQRDPSWSSRVPSPIVLLCPSLLEYWCTVVSIISGGVFLPRINYYPIVFCIALLSATSLLSIYLSLCYYRYTLVEKAPPKRKGSQQKHGTSHKQTTTSTPRLLPDFLNLNCVKANFSSCSFAGRIIALFVCIKLENIESKISTTATSGQHVSTFGRLPIRCSTMECIN